MGIMRRHCAIYATQKGSLHLLGCAGEVGAKPTEAEVRAEESQAAVTSASARWHESVLMPVINQQVLPASA